MKLSDYILEQSISTASIADIDFEQCFAEMNVFATALECCMKQEMILEYASGDVSEFTIFQEMEEWLPYEEEQRRKKIDEEKKKNESSQNGTTKNAVKTKKEFFLKKWWRSFIELIKRIGRTIAGWFTKLDYGSLKNKVKNNKRIDRYYFDQVALKRHAEAIEDLIKVYSEFVQIVSDKSKDGYKFKNIQEKIEQLDRRYKDIEVTIKDDSKSGVPKQEVLDFLTKMEELQKNEIPKFKQILKKANYKIDDYFSEDDDDQTKNEIVKYVKEIGKKLPVVYSKMNDKVLKLTAKMINQTNVSGNAPFDENEQEAGILGD